MIIEIRDVEKLDPDQLEMVINGMLSAGILVERTALMAAHERIIDRQPERWLFEAGTAEYAGPDGGPHPREGDSCHECGKVVVCGACSCPDGPS